MLRERNRLWMTTMSPGLATYAAHGGSRAAVVSLPRTRPASEWRIVDGPPIVVVAQQGGVANYQQVFAAVTLLQASLEVHAGDVRRAEELAVANTRLRETAAVLDDTVRARTTELMASLEDLNVVNDQHRRLLRRMVTMQEEERHRIANDIHDDTLQAIIVAQMRLHMLQLKTGDAAVGEELQRIGEAVGDGIDRLRGLMFELRPDDLSQGVAAVLRRHLDDIVAVTGITAEVNEQWNVEPAGVEQLTLYRIAREALVNVRKHVANGRVVVDLLSQDHGWTVRIRDEGPGFALSNGAPAPGHLGLTSMRERAEALGGRWHIESAAGAGTTVECWIPPPSHPAGETGTELS